MTAVAIAAAGALGALARWLTSRAAHGWLGPHFPWGTLVINVLGCFLLALVAESAAARAPWSPALRDGITVGFLGAFTTFSTFGYETLRAFERGAWGLGLLNIAGNVGLGLGACVAGVALARALTGGHSGL